MVATQILFYVHPYLGKMSILTNIFQMGWNHQIVNIDRKKDNSGWKNHDSWLSNILKDRWIKNLVNFLASSRRPKNPQKVAALISGKSRLVKYYNFDIILGR